MEVMSLIHEGKKKTLDTVNLFVTKRRGLPPARVYRIPYAIYNSRDGSVGIALGYGLDDRGSRV
jgi:hypothetical protein